MDLPLLRRSYAVIESVLRAGPSLTRAELGSALEKAGIHAAGPRLGHLLMEAELDAIVVSGPRRGRQSTYGLLEERAPSARRLDREEALAELTRRYFTGHGPAQVQDFAWWSGLTVADVRRGLAMVGRALAREEIGGKEHWSSPDAPVAPLRPPVVNLLPNYDEFLVAYRDRAASFDPTRSFDTAPFPYGSLLAHTVLLNGQVWGGWKRRLTSKELVVVLGPLDVLDETEDAALRQAARRPFPGHPGDARRPPRVATRAAGHRRRSLRSAQIAGPVPSVSEAEFEAPALSTQLTTTWSPGLWEWSAVPRVADESTVIPSAEVMTE